MLADQSVSQERYTPLELNHEDQRLYSYWCYYAEKGRSCHEQSSTKRALEAFQECIRISKLLLHCVNNKTREISGIELMFIASHNLAACHNQLHQASLGEIVLRELHTQIIDLCESLKNPRDLRLEALSVLDRSLFSLTSQLAYMGRLSEIHGLIENTETFADKVSKQLGNL